MNRFENKQRKRKRERETGRKKKINEKANEVSPNISSNPSSYTNFLRISLNTCESQRIIITITEKLRGLALRWLFVRHVEAQTWRYGGHVSKRRRKRYGGGMKNQGKAPKTRSLIVLDV